MTNAPATYPREQAVSMSLELASRGEPPYSGRPSIALERLHEAARRAKATPERAFHARPPWWSRRRWGRAGDVVSFLAYDVPTPHVKVVQLVVSSRSRHRILAFVNLVAGLRGAGTSVDEGLSTSVRYVSEPGHYLVGLAVIPGSRG